MADSLLSADQLNNDATAREEIINKWKDKPQTELLEAKAESDLYIKTLTARLDDLKNDYLQLRDQHQTSTQLKDIIERLEKDRGSATSNDTTHDTNRDTGVLPGPKPEDIQALVAQEVNKNRLIEKQASNFNLIESKLREQFGENYSAAYKQRLDTLGLTQEFADDLARNHPQVFIKTFELDQSSRQDSYQSPPRSTQRPASFAPKATVRDWNYYQNLKKENPRLYLDPKIAVQMHEDAIALGDAFGMPED